MRDNIFSLRVDGRDHGWGDANCQGCEPIESARYLRPHTEFGTSCPGLVHSERLLGEADEAKTILVCDTCFTNPQLFRSESCIAGRFVLTKMERVSQTLQFSVVIKWSRPFSIEPQLF
jgi:hypothetical protein